MSKNRDISLTEVLLMTQKEFNEFFSENGSVVVTPPEGYIVDFTKVLSLEDAITVIKYLTSLILPSTLYMDDRDFNKHPLKDYLTKVNTDQA